EILSDRTAAHAGGRGADADHEAEAEIREPALRRRDRRDVSRPRGGVIRVQSRTNKAKDQEAQPSLKTGQRRTEKSKHREEEEWNVENIWCARPCLRRAGAGVRACFGASNQGHQ